MEKTKQDIVEELKNTLLKDIELQEQVRILWRKIIRRLTIIFAALAIITIAMMSFIIYYITQPAPASDIVVKSIQDWNRIIQTQRQFIKYDRDDIAIARKELIERMRRLDSIENVKIKK